MFTSKYFKGCKNLDEFKTRYKELAKKYHPDLGGDVETMKEINNEYDELFPLFQKMHNSQKSENEQKNYENANTFRDIITALLLLHMKDVNIEIIGSWLWVSGKTKPYAEKLGHEGLKFRWSKSKIAWYWFQGIENTNKQKGYYSLEKCRNTFGSQVITESKNSNDLITV